MPELRYVVYDVAGERALAYDRDLAGAMARACETDGVPVPTDYLVAFTTRSSIPLDRFDGGWWPRDAEIVWRGASALAQACEPRGRWLSHLRALLDAFGRQPEKP
jgi:hypothetical protein